MDDGKKFREMLIAVCEKYDKTPSKVYVDMIWESLKEYNNQECIQAFNHVFRYGNFFKDIVSDLLKFLEENIKGVGGDKAILEADKILSHLKFYGATKYPKYTDPVTKHLMETRWPYKTWAINLLSKERTWWKKEFILSYKSFQASGDKPQQLTSKKVLKLIEKIG